MARIFLTGDTHGLTDIAKFTNWKEKTKLTKDDYLIIVGDFGGIFYGPRTIEDLKKQYSNRLPQLSAFELSLLLEQYNDQRTLNFYSNLPCTVLFIDGNHENFDALNSYEVSEWNGGKVHIIRDDIIHLMRGQVFNIDGKTFFTMGGATSIDKAYRKEGCSWWPQEIPTMEECNAALDKLKEYNYKVDYVLTHSAPDNILHKINPRFEHDLITNFLFSIDKDIQFKEWFFGHYHVDKDFSMGDGDKYHCLYQRVIEITKMNKSGRNNQNKRYKK